MPEGAPEIPKKPYRYERKRKKLSARTELSSEKGDNQEEIRRTQRGGLVNTGMKPNG